MDGLHLFLDKIDNQRKKSYKVYMHKNINFKKELTPRKEKPKNIIYTSPQKSFLSISKPNETINPYCSQDLLPKVRQK